MSMPDPVPFVSKGVHGNPSLNLKIGEVGGEYPKWIEPHPSHVVTLADGRLHVVDHEYHVDRENKITVLVHDAEDEAAMLAEKVKKAVGAASDEASSGDKGGDA